MTSDPAMSEQGILSTKDAAASILAVAAPLLCRHALARIDFLVQDDALGCCDASLADQICLVARMDRLTVARQVVRPVETDPADFARQRRNVVAERQMIVVAAGTARLMLLLLMVRRLLVMRRPKARGGVRIEFCE